MTTCESIQDDLDGFKDGVLESTRADEVRQHVSQCPACTSWLADVDQLENQLRETASTWELPPTLRARIRTAVREESRAADRGSDAGIFRHAWAAAATLVVAVYFGGNFFDRTSSDPVNILVSEFHTFVVSRRPLDYPSENPVSLRNWFTDKVDFRPPAPYQQRGIKLVGGRLCNIGTWRVAAYMYKSQGAWISLYIKNDDPQDRFSADFQANSVDGYGYVGWNDSGLTYALVGDVPVAELEDLASSIRERNTQRRLPDPRYARQAGFKRST